MALYIPHSIFHLARLLYVRPETFGPYYVCITSVVISVKVSGRITRGLYNLKNSANSRACFQASIKFHIMKLRSYIEHNSSVTVVHKTVLFDCNI